MSSSRHLLAGIWLAVAIVGTSGNAIAQPVAAPKPAATTAVPTPVAVTDLDEFEFAKFRNGPARDPAVREQIMQAVLDTHRKGHPTLEPATFRAWLVSAQGESERGQIAAEVERGVQLHYVQGHGIVIPAALSSAALLGLRRYLEAIGDHYDAADAVRGINAALRKGDRSASSLVLAAELNLLAERGLSPAEARRLVGTGLGNEGLQALREFVDDQATTQTGHYLRFAAGLKSHDLGELETQVARRLMIDRGFVLPADGPDLQTAISLLRDLDAFGPLPHGLYRAATSKALANGERDYYALQALGNREILRALKMDSAALARMAVGEFACQAAFPGEDVSFVRATALRRLRDRLWALPAEPRRAAGVALAKAHTNLLTFDAVLVPFQVRAIATLVGDRPELASHLCRAMTPQQVTNFHASLIRLEPSVRRALFDALPTAPSDAEQETVSRLVTGIEKTFDVRVNRTPGVYPDAAMKDAAAYGPFVADWPLQGLIDLHNALSLMRRGDNLPPGLRGTTFLRMAGEADVPSMLVADLPERPEAPTPFDVSSDYGHGTYGETLYDDRGHDIVMLYDQVMGNPNSDCAVGVPCGEATLLHEMAHAIQLGGEVGKDEPTRRAQEKTQVAQWSLLSGWQEPDGAVADGYTGDHHYYYNPAVRVARRAEVLTTYGASDPVEDFAEFTPFFYTDPATALALAPCKFLRFNELAGGAYAPDRVDEYAVLSGLGTGGLVRARTRLHEQLGL